MMWKYRLLVQPNVSHIKLTLSSTIPDKIVGTRSKFSPPPTYNVDNQETFSLFVETKKNATFSNID